MTQERSIPARTPGELTRVFSGRRFLVIAGSLIAAVGIIGIVGSAVLALDAPLDIRAFLESEKHRTAYGPDFTATWLWAALAAAGVSVLIVGALRGAARPRGL